MKIEAAPHAHPFEHIRHVLGRDIARGGGGERTAADPTDGGVENRDADAPRCVGGLIAPHLSDPARQFATLVAGYALWAHSVPVAFGILAILILRMALHKLPPASVAASSWLALGPIGTGALGVIVLGADAPAIFAAHGLAGIGPIAQGMGLVGGSCFGGLACGGCSWPSL